MTQDKYSVKHDFSGWQAAVNSSSNDFFSRNPRVAEATRCLPL